MRYLLIVLTLASCNTQAKQSDALRKRAIYALTRAQNLGAMYLLAQANENAKNRGKTDYHTRFYAYITGLSMRTSLYYQGNWGDKKFDSKAIREVYEGFESMSHRPMDKALKTNSDLVLRLLYSVLYGTSNTR